MKIIKIIFAVILFLVIMAGVGTYMMTDKLILDPISNIFNPEDTSEEMVEPMSETVTPTWPTEVEQNRDFINSNAEAIAAIEMALKNSDTKDKLNALNNAIKLQEMASNESKVELQGLIDKLSDNISEEISNLSVKLEDSEKRQIELLGQQAMQVQEAIKVAEAKIELRRCKDLERRNAKEINKLMIKIESAKTIKRVNKLKDKLSVLKCQL